MISSSDPCGVCGFAKEDHASLNHQYDAAGNLLPKVSKRSSTPASSGPVGDTLLRLILVLRAKGILTTEELEAIIPGVPNVRTNTDPETPA